MTAAKERWPQDDNRSRGYRLIEIDDDSNQLRIRRNLTANGDAAA